MASFTATIFSPHGKIFEGAVESRIAPGAEGFLEILSHHAPTAVLLKQGIVTVTMGTRRSYFAVGVGVLEVNQEHQVSLLVDFAIPATDSADAIEKLHADHSEAFLKSR